jgi:hypothetical protein
VSLFRPECRLAFLLDDGPVITPGTVVPGRITIVAPRPISRATALSARYRSYAWLNDEGEGGRREVVLAERTIRFDLREGLPEGRTERALTLEVPRGLPEAAAGSQWAIVHELAARLSVSWALDPKRTFVMPIRTPPALVVRPPVLARSPPGFDRDVVLDVSLRAGAVVVGTSLEGRVALRAGAEAAWESVVIVLSQVVTVDGGLVRRRFDLAEVELPRGRFPADRTLMFRFVIDSDVAPTVPDARVSVRYMLRFAISRRWSQRVWMELSLEILPKGTDLRGQADVPELGDGRRRRLAEVLAHETGLSPGDGDVLVEGREGPVEIEIRDAPEDGELGVEVALAFPSLGVAVRTRPPGLFRGGRRVPPELDGKMHVTVDVPPRRYAREPLGEREIFAILEGLGGATSVDLASRSLRFRLPATDSVESLVAVVRLAKTKAQVLSSTISALPFPLAFEPHRAAWEATAAERDAHIVPSGPHLLGAVVVVRTLLGEERRFVVNVRTLWEGELRAMVEVSCPGLGIPAQAYAALDGATPHAALLPALAVLEGIHAREELGLAGHVPGLVADPRRLLSAAEDLVSFWLEVRGERRVDAPYR